MDSINTAAPFGRNILQAMKEMKAELDEHRYFLERNVELRTEHLLKRIAVLEACNTTLCDKLALAQAEVAALKRHPPYPAANLGAKSSDRTMQLRIMNNAA